MRLWLFAVAAWVADVFGQGIIGRVMRRWLSAELDVAESLAKCWTVLLMPPSRRMHDYGPATDRPHADALRDKRSSSMRMGTRGLLGPFLSKKRVRERIVRLSVYLARIDAHARKLRRRLDATCFFAFAPGERDEDRAAPAAPALVLAGAAFDTS